MSSPRFLVVRFSAIGDCVMAAWAATAIRQKYPDSFLCWAIESRCAPVVGTGVLASELAEFPRDAWKQHRWSPRVWRDQILAFTRLRPIGFDYGIDLQGHSKTALCLRIASPKNSIAVRATDRLSSSLNPVAGVCAAGIHTIELNHAVLLRAFGDFPFPTKPIMPDRPEARMRVRRQLANDGPLATIAVGAGHPSKVYPLEYWREVARGLLNAGYRVAYLGGPDETRPCQPGTTDLVGRLALGDTLEAVARSDVHLAADTGTGHMAAALGVPVVSVFGPTDPAVFRPYTESGIVLREGTRTDAVLPQRIVDAAASLVGRGRARVLN